jgi:hypothetical protein
VRSNISASRSQFPLLLGAQVAFINVVPFALAYPGDTGMPLSKTQRDAKEQVSALHQCLRPRSPLNAAELLGADTEYLIHRLIALMGLCSDPSPSL